MTFRPVDAALCTGPASRAKVTGSSFINVCQKTEILHPKDGGGLLQLPNLRVGAATGASNITFLAMYAESGVDLTRCILHEADLQA